MKMKSFSKGLLATAALALAVVVTPVSTVEAEAAEGAYTVEKGDYLYKIAKKVYGNGELWKVIYDANAGIVKKNYTIYQGQTLVIPDVNGTLAAAPASQTPATETQTPAQTPQTQAPAPAQQTPQTQAQAPQAPAQNSEQQFVLDYNQLAPWIHGGFVGTSTTGETVILALDSESDYGLAIFEDNSDMTAASFLGPITYNNEYMTITDETNGLSITFIVAEVSDGTLSLNMGDLGVATVTVQAREIVLDYVKKAIEGYTHVA